MYFFVIGSQPKKQLGIFQFSSCGTFFAFFLNYHFKNCAFILLFLPYTFCGPFFYVAW